MDWDITVTAKAEKGETISSVEVRVNGSSVCSEEFNPPISQWNRVLTQQGQYPGENKTEFTVADSNGNESVYDDEWQ